MTSPRACASNGANAWAMTTLTPCRLRTTSARRFRTWAAMPRPASWTRTSWPAAAACSARTTLKPWTLRLLLAVDLTNLGEYQAARELDEDTLARYRRVFGEDHPSTLMSANNLAVDLRILGEYQAARELDEDTLARYRRVLGEDHPSTLRSAGNLAVDLTQLGEYQAARELDEDTLARRRRVLGEDHPDTLDSAGNLATDLRDLGEYQAARELDEDTLARYRRCVRRGPPQHPDVGEQPRRRPEGPRGVSGGPRAGRGHPGPLPPVCSARTTPALCARRATSPST